MDNKGRANLTILLGCITAIGPTAVLFLSVTYLFVVPLGLGLLLFGLGIVARGAESRSFLARCSVWIAVAGSFLGCCGPCGLMWYADLPNPPVHFIVPDDYRGPIRIVIDPLSGVEVPLQDGVYTFVIPRDGILTIRTDDPFRGWHQERVTYENGKAIPRDHGAGPDTVTLRHFGSDEQRIEYFLGNERQWKHWVENRYRQSD